MTLAITGEMLATYSEADLLRVAMAIYTILHPLENPLDAIAHIVGVTPEMLNKALARDPSHRSHLGYERWARVQEALGVKLYQEFIAVKAEKR